MPFISDFIFKIKRMLGFVKLENDLHSPQHKAEEPTNIGTQGRIDADTVILRDHDRMILSIDFDFKDILGWVRTGPICLDRLAAELSSEFVVFVLSR